MNGIYCEHSGCLLLIKCTIQSVLCCTLVSSQSSEVSASIEPIERMGLLGLGLENK